MLYDGYELCFRSYGIILILSGYIGPVNIKLDPLRTDYQFYLLDILDKI